MTSLPIISNESPSFEFEDAFCDCGSSRRTCSCGRTWFSSYYSQDFERGELEDLLKRMEESPDAYYDTLNRSIGVIFILGNPFVVGCPCNGLRFFEDFLLNNRYEIAKYFESLMENCRRETEVSKRIVDSIQGEDG